MPVGILACPLRVARTGCCFGGCAREMVPFLLASAFAQLASTSAPETFLGDSGADTLWVQQLFTPIPNVRFCWLTLRFSKRHADRIISSQDFKIWASSGVPDVFCVGYYSDSKRRQIFVSMTAQSITSYLLDYDGKKVHILYEPGQGRWYGGGQGRVFAFPVFDAKGNTAIRESFYVKEKAVKGRRVFVGHPYRIIRVVPIKKE